LSRTAQDSITDSANIKFVSPASYWELAIKVALGKYQLTETFDEFVQHAIFDNGFTILAIEPRYMSSLITLPQHHRDPFDGFLSRRL
jgi:PIN domain nuclease of toxin-antitoxin system